MAVEGGCIAASPEPDDDALLEEFQTQLRTRQNSPQPRILIKFKNSNCFYQNVSKKCWESHISAQSIYLLSSVQIGDTLSNKKQASKQASAVNNNEAAAKLPMRTRSFLLLCEGRNGLGLAAAHPP
jgi:hypothetical protein